MHAVRVLVIVVCAFVVGSGIAAIPYWENDPCSGFYVEVGPGVTWVTQLVPYGTRCEREAAGGWETVNDLVPSTGEWVAWLAVTTVVLAAAWRWRRFASARGVGLAAGVLGLFGLVAHQAEGAAALMGAVVLGAPVVLAGDRLLRPAAGWPVSLVLGASLPLVVMAVWFAPGLMGYEEVAAVLVLLAGAGTAAAAEWLVPRFVRSSRSSPPRPG